VPLRLFDERSLWNRKPTVRKIIIDPSQVKNCREWWAHTLKKTSEAARNWQQGGLTDVSGWRAVPSCLVCDHETYCVRDLEFASKSCHPENRVKHPTGCHLAIPCKNSNAIFMEITINKMKKMGIPTFGHLNKKEKADTTSQQLLPITSNKICTSLSHTTISFFSKHNLFL